MIDGDQLYAGTVADYQVRILLLSLVISVRSHWCSWILINGVTFDTKLRSFPSLACTFLAWNFLTINSKSACKAEDPHQFYADLDPSLTLMRIRIHRFTSMRIGIRIRLFTLIRIWILIRILPPFKVVTLPIIFNWTTLHLISTFITDFIDRCWTLHLFSLNKYLRYVLFCRVLTPSCTRSRCGPLSLTQPSSTIPALWAASLKTITCISSSERVSFCAFATMFNVRFLTWLRQISFKSLCRLFGLLK